MGESMVNTEEDDAYFFPLYCMENPLAINEFNFEFLTKLER